MSLRIEVISLPDSPNKVKGDLLETLCTELLQTQSYEVETQVRGTAGELDLLCKHKVNGRVIYVECKALRDTLSANVLKNLLGTIDFKEYEEGWLISAGPLGKDAKGFKVEWEKKPQEKRQRLSIYDPERIVAALRDAHLICDPPEDACSQLMDDLSSTGEWVLLISESGIFWACTCLRSGIPTGVVLFDAKTTDQVTDPLRLRLIAKLDSTLSSLDFEYINKLASIVSDSKPIYQPPQIVEVQYGESWDDYRPARPEHFIGRADAQDRILRFLTEVRDQTTSTRVFAITGNTGMGKSSLVAKLRARVENKFWRKRFYMYAVDVRAANGPNYITSALLNCLRGAASQGCGTADPSELLISDHADPLASKTIQQYLESLRDKKQVVCLVLDQFEELYSKPDMYPVFVEAQRLFLSAVASCSNLVVGFVLRSDSTVQQDHPAYYMWHKLADHRFETKLRVFQAGEISAALTLFEKELGQALRPELRRQLAENSEGYPWLLKKLCIHLYEQIRAGTDQADLDETMDVELLFASDLSGCTSKERTCLQLIAGQSPADWFEVLDTVGTEVVRSLQDRRLIIRSGDRLNVYWDVFREYVLTKKVPSIPFTYLCSAPSIGAFLSVASMLSKDEAASSDKISKDTGLASKTVSNVIHDLIMFGIGRGKPSAVFLGERMPSSNEHDVLERVRTVFKRHALVLQLRRLEEGALITVDDMVATLREINPSANHRQSTWRIYSERLGTWLVAAGLMEVTSKGWILRDIGHASVPSKKGSRFRLGCFSGDAPPWRVVESLNWLAQNQPSSLQVIRSQGYRNALRVLDRLDLTARDDNGLIVVVNVIGSVDEAQQLIWHAARLDESLQQVWGYLQEHPNASGMEVGEFLNRIESQGWSDASKIRTGNAVKPWAVWVGNDDCANCVIEAPGRRIRKQRSKSDPTLFCIED